jgi:hypothetical protein
MINQGPFHSSNQEDMDVRFSGHAHMETPDRLYNHVHLCLVLLVSSITFLAHGVSPAQETGDNQGARSDSGDTGPSLEPGVYRLSAGSVESWKIDDDTRAIMLSGGAELSRQNERLTASRIIGWTHVQGSDGESPIPGKVKLDRFYAEENVLYWRNDEFLQAEKLYMNLWLKTGAAQDVTYRTYNPERDVPVVVRAKKFLQTGEGTYKAHSVEFTTCDYAKPHYSVGADTLRILRLPDGETAVSATHLTPQIQGVPFGYWPFLYAESDFDLGPLKRVEYGSNDRFGSYIETLWGWEFSSVKRDDDGNVIRDKNGNKVYDYDIGLDVRLDYRERRGLAIGPEIDYQFDRDHEGFLYTYFMNDIKGPNPDNDFDRQFLPREKEHRGRAWWFHRYDLYGTGGDLEQLRLDTEANLISDRHFMEEFFEEEFKTGKDRETYTYLRYVDDNTYGSFLTRYRLNSFQTQTEYLPALRYTVHGEEVPNLPLVYSSDSSIGNLRRRRSRLSSQSDFRSGRLDTYQQLAYPFSVGFIQARGFTGGRLTQYEQDPARDEDLTRYVLSGGMELFDDLHRTFAVQSDSLGLDGLRHIFSWHLRYSNNFASNRAPNRVPSFDQRDPVGEHEEIYLELRNRFQTRTGHGEDEETNSEDQEGEQKRQNEDPSGNGDRASGQKTDLGNVHEFLSIGAAIEHYPNTNRDRRRIRAQNHLDPAAWITSVQSPSSGQVLDDNYSLLNADFQFEPTLPFSLQGEYELNLEQRRIEASNSSFSLYPEDDLSLSIRHSFVRGLTETVNLDVRTRLSDHWLVSGTASYDLDQSDNQDIQLGLGYRLHDFTVRFGAQFDDRRDDRAFTISITPNFTDARFFDFDVAEQ